MYIERTIQNQLQYLAGHFPVVLVCGARQTGKTTLLRKIQQESSDSIGYVTLDYPALRLLARTDPELFLQQYAPPVIIDEIQYAPELLPYIKIRVDEHTQPGQYYLTGSQMFHLMQNVSESLAGRVGILSMYSLSRAEISGQPDHAPFVPGRQDNRVTGQEPVSVIFEEILRGSLPKMITDPDLHPEDFYGSYMQTYLERDIRNMVEIQNESKFLRFLAIVAARTASELNLSAMASDVGIDSKTAEKWLSILVTSGIVYLLQPYAANTRKRIIKRPKLYFMDTGLACYLSLWNNARTLELSAMAGAMFETYVISEIIKGYANHGLDPRSRLCYYRDQSGREIDLLILENDSVYPVEIKKSANPGRDALKNFGVLSDLGKRIGSGAVICMSPMVLPLDANNTLVPVGCI